MPSSTVRIHRRRRTKAHDGYLATVELDEDAGLFHGEVVNTRDVLTFQGRTLDELNAAFADIHCRAVAAAAREGASLNGFVSDVLNPASG